MPGRILWGGECIWRSAENPALLDAFERSAGVRVEFAGDFVAEGEGLAEDDFLAGVGSDVAAGFAREADGEDGGIVYVHAAGGPDDEAVFGVFTAWEDGALDGDFILEEGVSEDFEELSDSIAWDIPVGASDLAVVGVELEDGCEGLVGTGVVRDAVGEVEEGAGALVGDLECGDAEWSGLDGEFPAAGDRIGLWSGDEVGYGEGGGKEGEEGEEELGDEALSGGGGHGSVFCDWSVLGCGWVVA